MSSTALHDAQMTMARFLRDPENEPAPVGVEERRLKIYQDLIFNNIEGFIQGGFPVLHSLYNSEDWHALVRQFIDGHRCHSPYFLEISQEFLQFLTETHELRPCDPAFMAELAHYEWVELGLDVSEAELPPLTNAAPLPAIPQWSPLAWLLSYAHPVHQIGPSFQPAETAEPTFLIVYRNCEDEVKFLALNAATARLAEMLRDNESKTGEEILAELAAQMNVTAESIIEFGAQQLNELQGLGVISLKIP